MAPVQFTEPAISRLTLGEPPKPESTSVRAFKGDTVKQTQPARIGRRPFAVCTLVLNSRASPGRAGSRRWRGDR